MSPAIPTIPKMSLRLQGVQSPIISTVAQWVRAHPRTISLGQGVVHYGPPPQTMENLARFAENENNHKYQPVDGLPFFIDALEEKLRKENKITVRPASRVIVTAGGNMAFMNAVLAIADPGDEVILQTPYYFNHEMAIQMASCQPVPVATGSDYQLDCAAIQRAITPRTRAVVTVSPNNPTGAVYPQSVLREINDLCRTRGIFHIHDEAYEYFTYDGAHHFSPGSIEGSGPHTISLFSFSKAYGFASWRIGYMVIPECLVDSVKKIQDTIAICPPVISQYGALGALQAGPAYCFEKREGIAAVREFAISQLRQIEQIASVPRTGGAFYFFIKLNTDCSSMEIARRLIEEHGVAVIPGSAFGMSATSGCYVRVSFGALQRQTAEEGIARLVSGLKALIR